ncbi:Mediator of RNA polymerase II transcription subunit 6 [Myotisia sp. PD_48]|nr:Mediator of RNA polymerase II transcription subunit 6 [Myotisia sp. PD_48]
MEPQTDVPLEEITWRSPQHVQMMGGFLHSNNILFYFAESPFFDPTSNNATLTLQAMHNENFRPFIETREAFEGRLKSMQGLEFMVAYDPIQEAAETMAGGGQSAEPSNIWVIRKQIRKRDDEAQILATYYVVGDFVYMAPSVLSVIGRRMLSTVSSLTRVLPIASQQLLFSSSHGHTYTPPVSTSGVATQLGSTSQSTRASKEPSPLPIVQNTSASLSSSSYLDASAAEDMRTLSEALNLLSRYGDEYMDETPLIGEPGSFIFSKAAAPNPPNNISSGAAAPAPNLDERAVSNTPAASQATTRSAVGTPAARSAGPGTPAVISSTSIPSSSGRVEQSSDRDSFAQQGWKGKPGKKRR